MQHRVPRLLYTGDSTALTVTHKVIETIGWGVSSLLSIFDPANIYLGGDVE